MCLGPTRLEHRNEEFSEDPETRFTAVSWPMRLAFARASRAQLAACKALAPQPLRGE